MPVVEYAQAVLRQLLVARFLEDALLELIGTGPTDLGFHRDIAGIQGRIIGNQDSSRRAIEQRRHIPSVKAGLPEADSTAGIGAVVSVPRCVGGARASR